VPEPRGFRGRRHQLSALITADAASVPADARSLTAITEWTSDAQEHQSAWTAFNRRPRAGKGHASAGVRAPCCWMPFHLSSASPRTHRRDTAYTTVLTERVTPQQARGQPGRHRDGDPAQTCDVLPGKRGTARVRPPSIQPCMWSQGSSGAGPALVGAVAAVPWLELGAAGGAWGRGRPFSGRKPRRLCSTRGAAPARAATTASSPTGRDC